MVTLEHIARFGFTYYLFPNRSINNIPGRNHLLCAYTTFNEIFNSKMEIQKWFSSIVNYCIEFCIDIRSINIDEQCVVC
jgi:hypothetical protein